MVYHFVNEEADTCRAFLVFDWAAKMENSSCWMVFSGYERVPP